MEPVRAEATKGADRAPEVVTGFFIGSVAGYRLMVGWMIATILILVGGFWLVAERLRVLTVAVEGIIK